MNIFNRKNRENNKKQKKSVLVRIFKDWTMPNIKYIIFIAIMSILVGLSEGAIIWVMKHFLDEGLVGKNIDKINILVLCLISAYLLKNIILYIIGRVSAVLNLRLGRQIRLRLLNKLLKMNIPYFHSTASGTLQNIYFQFSGSVGSLAVNPIINIIKDGITVVFMMGAMIWLSPSLSLVLILVTPLIFIPMLKAVKKLRNLSKEIMTQNNTFQGKINETFLAIDLVKNYQTEDFEMKKQKKMENLLYKINLKREFITAKIKPLTEMSIGLGIGYVLYMGGINIAKGTITIGDFIAFILATQTAFMPLKRVINTIVMLQQQIVLSEGYYKILDTNTDMPEACRTIETDAPLPIEFKNVSFSYPKQEDDKYSLNKVSFTFEPNKSYAIVGFSGSGKSTMFKLLMNWYDEYKGSIKVGGVPLKNIKPTNLSQMITLVSQDNFIFRDSIMDNIKYSKISSSNSNVIEASKKAEMHDFISTLPKKYNAEINMNTLSGGQKQRIEIARAILKDSPILLFDEPTSSLDSSTEKKIFGSLKKITKNKTVIIIAHRLSTIQDVDCILVMNQGKIVEQGSHMDLIKLDGLYSKLSSLQKTTLV
ncbi:MAG: ABC transporter ATP-binding protein [Alphaproteobacteria bacterium]|nr:ABC transporter ATP-binding protein [Alphaproteobacteria bacterium]MBL0718129.1 ABC transporter ATP-binding protein [Alphaproteobacteria bacterium]